MALRFYYGANAGNSGLDSTEYNAGADTAGTLVNSGTVGTTQVRVGTHSVRSPASSVGGMQWTVGGTDALFPWTGSGVVLDTQGCVGYWSRQDTALYAAAIGNQRGFRFRAAAASTYSMEGNYAGTSNSGDYCFRIAGSGGVAKTLSTSGGQVTANNWFFEVYRWDFPNGKMRIEIYDTSLALVDSAQDLAVSFTSTNTPADISTFVIGAKVAGSTNAADYDNYLVSDVYNAPLQSNAFITDYTTYTESTATVAPKASFYRMLRSA